MATRTAKKQTGLDKQNNNFAQASSLFVHFFAVTAWLRHENAYNFKFYGEHENKATTLFFFS